MSIRWTQDALDRLAELYVVLPLERQRELAQVVDAINDMLATGASSLGESRTDPGRRVWCHGPLAVTFRLKPDGDVVVLFVSRLKHGAVGERDLD